MRPRLIQLQGLDVLAARDQVAAWGFPRPVHEQELFGAWLSLGADLIFWLAPDTTCRGGEATLHVCKRPGSRTGPIAVLWHTNLLAMADLLRLRGLRASPPDPAHGRILERFGWTREPDGWYLSLVDPEGG